MDEKLARFLKKINFDYEEKDFLDVKVSKVVVKKQLKTWDIYLSSVKPLNIKIIDDLKNICKKGLDDVKSINIILEYQNVDETDIIKALDYYIDKMIEKNPSLSTLKDAEIKYEESIISLEVTNQFEEKIIKNNANIISEFLCDNGYGHYEIKPLFNQEKRELIKKEIKEEKPEAYIEQKPEFKVLIGESIKTSPIKIKEIIMKNENII